MLQEALDTLIALPDPDGGRAVLTAAGRPQFQDELSKGKIYKRLMNWDDPAAVDYVLKEMQARPQFVDEASVQWLLQKDPEGAAGILLAQAQKDGLTPPLISYFAQKRYTPSIPLLVSSIEKNQNTEACMKALADMRSPDADAAVLSMAQKDGPAQLRAVQALPDLQDASKKNEARTVLETMWKNNPPGELRTAALNGFAKMRGMNPSDLEREAAFPMAEIQGDLAAVTYEDQAKKRDLPGPANVQPSQPVTPAVVPAKPTQPAQPAQPVRPAQPLVSQPTTPQTQPIRPAQPAVQPAIQPQKPSPRNEVASKPADKPAVKPIDKPAAVKPTDKPAANPADKASAVKPDPRDEPPPLDERAARAYREKIGNIFYDTFGDAGGSQVLKRIQDSLYTYSESNSTAADFVIRSYRKRYGGTDGAIRKMLARGLKQPDCVAALVNNIKTEYPSREMQIYALSKIFALQRWQSQVILELSQEVQL